MALVKLLKAVLKLINAFTNFFMEAMLFGGLNNKFLENGASFNFSNLEEKTRRCKYLLKC